MNPPSLEQKASFNATDVRSWAIFATKQEREEFQEVEDGSLSTERGTGDRVALAKAVGGTIHSALRLSAASFIPRNAA